MPHADSFGTRTGDPHHPPQPDGPAVGKVALASFIGNFVEWFDYASYGYLATVIARVFFAEQDPGIALLETYAVFAMSFILRPIGGVIWGSIGDRFGRKLALSWSILIMSGSSFLIGLLPGYADAGVAAPIGLLLLRMCQGFSASGEYAGASAYLAEYAPPRRRGFLTAVVPASTATGLLAGSLLVTLLHATMTPEMISSVGWRIPFLLAGPLGVVGLYMRTHLEDSPHFSDLVQRGAQLTTRESLSTLIRYHHRQLAIACGVTCLNAVAFYLILSYLPTYMITELGVDDEQAFLSSSLALALYVFAIFAMGRLSDRLGRRKLLIGASVLFIVLTVPLFMALPHLGPVGLTLVVVLFSVMLTVNDGTLPTFLAECFPTSIRYMGFAISFNVANAIFGGTAPMVATFLIGRTGSSLMPAFYLTAVAICALLAMLKSRETAFTELPHG